MTEQHLPLAVQRIEQGWPGHFCAADSCMFRRNTLLRCDPIAIIVSTVGNWYPEGEFPMEIGCGKYYETLAFHAARANDRLADVKKKISFESPWYIGELPSLANDMRADMMHEKAVAEITANLASGSTYREDNS